MVQRITNIVTLSVVLFLVLPLRAQVLDNPNLPEPLRQVRFEQRLNEQIPLNAAFVDSTGKAVKLGEYFTDQPVVLVFAYYQCPRLCTMVLNGLVQGMLEINLTAGQEFQIVTVSFDPTEDAELAAAKKRSYIKRYARPGAEEGWHFLTGTEDQIRSLTEAVGFQYSYDPQRRQYVHASGIVILTPQGKISRYFYDLEYPGRDLRLGLVEASQNKIGSPVDVILLYCFHYDAAIGKYTASIMNIVRAGGVLTLILIGLFVVVLRKTTPKYPEAGDHDRRWSQVHASSTEKGEP